MGLYAEPWVFKKMDNAQKELGIVLNQFASIYEKGVGFGRSTPVVLDLHIAFIVSYYQGSLYFGKSQGGELLHKLQLLRTPLLKNLIAVWDALAQSFLFVLWQMDYFNTILGATAFHCNGTFITL